MYHSVYLVIFVWLCEEFVAGPIVLLRVFVDCRTQTNTFCAHFWPPVCGVTHVLLSHRPICTAGKNWSLALSPITGMFAPGLKRGDGKPFDRTGWERPVFVPCPVLLSHHSFRRKASAVAPRPYLPHPHPASSSARWSARAFFYCVNTARVNAALSLAIRAASTAFHPEKT